MSPWRLLLDLALFALGVYLPEEGAELLVKTAARLAVLAALSELAVGRLFRRP